MTAKDPSQNFKNVLITGASSGIGREVALQLAASAEHVWICGRNSTELRRTQALMNQTHPQLNVTCLLGDLTKDRDREQLLNAVAEQNLDLVVLNAGGGDFGLFCNSSWETERQVIDLNITATVHLTHALLPHLKKTSSKNSKKGAFVFVSSHAAFLHVPHFAVYASAKSFINSFALTLMQEERGNSVDFLLVCPGATATQFAERAGLPRQMLGSPKSASDVAQRIVSNIGKRQMLIINSFDRLLYVASRLLPTFIFDAVVARAQYKLLARAHRHKEISL